jgi:pilus assembly protein CpaB
MRRPGIIFLFAIVIGALLAALVYGNLNAQRAELAAARAALERGTVDVLVASQPIPIGSRLDATLVRTVRWPSDIQPAGVIHDANGLTGRVVRTAIDANQPIVESQLVNEGNGLLPLLITEGMRGISVKVDDVTGVSGFITPSSRVDVLVSGNDGGENGQQRSKVILQNVKVLAIGKSIEQKDDKPIEVPTVTLLVSPADAEKLTLATRQEPVRLALRNYRDDELVGTPGMSQRELFGFPAPTLAVPAEAPRPVLVRRAPPRPYVVDVLLGSKVYQEQFFPGSGARIHRQPADPSFGDMPTMRDELGGTFGG